MVFYQLWENFHLYSSFIKREKPVPATPFTQIHPQAVGAGAVAAAVVSATAASALPT